jgi:hypothetical protein
MLLLIGGHDKCILVETVFLITITSINMFTSKDTTISTITSQTKLLLIKRVSE